jgi:hypothetical protein
MLREPLTKLDCGTLCKSQNNGVPFCCDVSNAIPLLYKKEFRLFKSRTNLWNVWKPGNKKDAKLLEDLASDIIFCECRGVKFCERENRSISCRTFPFEPYFDKRELMVGLVFNYDFIGKCPLTTKKNYIPQSTIDQHFNFWLEFTSMKEDELDCYVENSKTLRRRRGQTKKEFKIFYPTHLKKQKKQISKYI